MQFDKQPSVIQATVMEKRAISTFIKGTVDSSPSISFYHDFLILFTRSMIGGGKKKDALPFGGAIMASATEGSVSPSLLPPLPPSLPPSLSISLSTIAIMQFRLFPTLAHTLSWKKHEYHYTFLLQKQDKAKSD